MQFTCGFIGLGLIGGSIARAIRRAIPDALLLAYDIDTKSLDAACKDGVINRIISSVGPEFSDCDYIFLCAPVSCNADNIQKIAPFLSDRTILTDVGSTKSDIHEHVCEAGLSAHFIGGHPMAGSERTGYANSKAALLENAYYILTPCEDVSSDKIAAYRNLVERMGAIPLIMNCDQHDFATAAISHLPHAIAFSLVNLVKDTDGDAGILKMIAAGGFKDITRIASSSPVMWEHIFETNSRNVAILIDRFIDYLSMMQEAMEHQDGEALYKMIESARDYRDSFVNASSGPIKRVFAISVDIADKAGALAAIINLLADHEISIKNIGITHNREEAFGSLELEFYEEKALMDAADVIKANGYETTLRKI